MREQLSHLITRVHTLSFDDLKSEEGQTTVEYAVVLVLVVTMAIAVFATLTTGVGDVMTAITDQLTGLIPL